MGARDRSGLRDCGERHGLLVEWAREVCPEPAVAHSGGLNAQGCHNDRRSSGYHCHRGSRATAAPTIRSVQPTTTNRPYANCAAVRAAGAAPVYRGQPGYGSHLDRDNDGIGCE